MIPYRGMAGPRPGPFFPLFLPQGTGHTLVVRRPTLLALVVFAGAFVASAPSEEEPYEVFNSIPGPVFRLNDTLNVADWLVTVRTSVEAFPARGDWTELFEVELDLSQEGFGANNRVVSGRLARVAPGGRTVLSSTVARVMVSEVATLVLTDELGRTDCVGGLCEKSYFVRFVFSGFGMVQGRWFIRAGVDWADRTDDVPEEAHVTLVPQRL